VNIAIVHESFTEKAGYTENNLARTYARLGHTVTIVTTTLQGYHQLTNYEEIFGRFLGPRKVAAGTIQWNGCTLYRLEPIYPLGDGQVAIRGLSTILKRIRPDVVQTLAAANFVSQQCAAMKWLLGYRLFTGAHQTLSVFDPSVTSSSRWSLPRLRSDLRRFVPGRFVSLATEKCFAVTPDCAQVATDYYGVELRKISLSYIGVETALFHPACTGAERAESDELRASWEVGRDTLLCLYTGRLTPNKNPLCLAQAIQLLRRKGVSVEGVFVGDGPQRETIESVDGCRVLPFQPWIELPRYYRAADVGIWPCEESMSALDAAACGIPIVLGNHVKALERIEGNGYTYQTGSAESLAETIQLLKARETREKLGAAGARKVQKQFSWDVLAQTRVSEYAHSLNGNSKQ
jgi:glycosyltransferase involved in cell wall biosynthesis